MRIPSLTDIFPLTWDILASGGSDRLRAVQWHHPQELPDKLLEELVRGLRLAGPEDEIGFEQTLPTFGAISTIDHGSVRTHDVSKWSIFRGSGGALYSRSRKERRKCWISILWGESGR
jgi:hypothetical protein